MQIIKKIKSLIMILCLFYNSTANALENKILFKVNNEIITSIDIFNEIKYLKILNKNLQSLKKDQIFEISKNSIIKEKIKIIELSKYYESFDVDEKFYELLMQDFIKRIGLRTKKEAKEYLKNNEVDFDDVKRKIQIELLWNDLIVRKYSKDIKINKDIIKEEILRNNYQKEFLISEILFNLEQSEKLETKLKEIQIEIIKSGFANAALIYSISDSANNGGNLGWIKVSALNPRIKKNIINLKVGEITDPIVIPGGFLILKIEDKKDSEKIIDLEEETKIIEREIANKQLNQFSNIYFSRVKQEVQINGF